MVIQQVDLDKIKEQPIYVLKGIYKEGKKHLEYFARTNEIFKNANSRIKCYDTIYYEQVLPSVIEILKEKGDLK